MFRLRILSLAGLRTQVQERRNLLSVWDVSCHLVTLTLYFGASVLSLVHG